MEYIQFQPFSTCCRAGTGRESVWMAERWHQVVRWPQTQFPSWWTPPHSRWGDHTATWLQPVHLLVWPVY